MCLTGDLGDLWLRTQPPRHPALQNFSLSFINTVKSAWVCTPMGGVNETRSCLGHWRGGGCRGEVRERWHAAN